MLAELLPDVVAVELSEVVAVLVSVVDCEFDCVDVAVVVIVVDCEFDCDVVAVDDTEEDPVFDGVEDNDVVAVVETVLVSVVDGDVRAQLWNVP